MLRSFVFAAFAACAVLSSTPPVAAQTKVGIINLQRAILETGELKKASADLEKKYKPRTDALEKLQRELADIQTQLQSSQGKLSPAGEADLTALGQKKQRDAQRISEDLQADVDRERNEILQRAGARMSEVVKKLAEEKTLDVVVDITNAIYYKPALEITDEAIAGYDKAYPVK